MPGRGSFLVFTIIATLCMLGGVGMIIAGAIGLYDDDLYDDGSAWGLLWAGIALELIGSTLFAVARRIRWHYYMRERCAHHHRPCNVANVEYVTSPPTYVVAPPGYSVQGYAGQPLGVPTAAGFAAPGASAPGLPPYEYATSPPPLSQAPPAYEAPK